ncbi:MAG: imidazole glycerol-phosphate synthase subunit HisH [Thermoleophilaceae bacterium]|nr:imidazole glycerol-phosphate synthase subunit HisH [Thermoleophilaceae bacterium]MEA2469265.1 imidazole glycerol-phosphate synthase subunit HisH [Thermoleophilaceae bacterium]
MRVALLNYGMGNLTSATMAFEHVGASVELTSDHARVRDADAVVLPGVGAFPKAMEAVRRLGLDDLVRERHQAGVPILGICLGMQLLFESSTELGGAEGIGLLRGSVEPLDSAGLKIPQIGWNEVRWREGSVLGVGERSAMYHVHSFAAKPADPDVVVGTATYGNEFVSAVEHDCICGVQFHPEKSSSDGLLLLSQFVRSAARNRAPA